MELSKMNSDELKALRKQVDQELRAREQQEKQEALRKIQQIAQEAGLTLDEVASARRGRRKAPAKVRYRDPENPSNTWAGRGRKPRWLEDKLKKGKKLEDFAV